MKRKHLLISFLALSLLAQASVIGHASPSAKVERSSFYDLPSLFASEGTAVGIALIDEEQCTVSQSTQPSVFNGNSLLNCNNLGIRDETTIAVNPTNPNNIIAASHRYRLSQQGSTFLVSVVSAAYTSTDGGTTWTNIIPPFGNYQFWGDPSLTFDSKGRAYFALIADHEGQAQGPVFLFTNVSVIVYFSDDGGFTWNGPVTVAQGNGGVRGAGDFNDKVWVTADQNPNSPFQDRAYITWTRFLAGQNGAFIEAPIYESHSDDGINWTPGKEVSGSNAAFCTTQSGDLDTGACDEDQGSVPVVGPDGTVYVAFENFNTPADNQMMVVRSTNGGASFQPPVFVTVVVDGPGRYPINSDGRNTLTGCQLRVNARGNIAVDPTTGTLYLVWDDNRAGTASQTNVNVFLARSTDQGNAWTIKTVSNAARDQFYPWAAVGPTGDLAVGYMDRQYQPAGASCQYGFTLSTSHNNGNSFTHQRVDTGLSRADNSRWFGKNTRFIGDYNNVAIGPDNRAWADWTDMRQDTTFLGITRADQDAVATSVQL